MKGRKLHKRMKTTTTASTTASTSARSPETTNRGFDSQPRPEGGKSRRFAENLEQVVDRSDERSSPKKG